MLSAELNPTAFVAAETNTDEPAGDETSTADTTAVDGEYTATDDEPAIEEPDNKTALGDTGTTEDKELHNTAGSDGEMLPQHYTLHLISLSQDVRPGQDKGTFLAKDARLGKLSVLHVFGVLAKTPKTPKTNMYFY
ncbi:hypothetical protein DFH09DRAFT_1337672 [Mycena vulgaris]|nr:hypothetical protein DFH09DRAFT_1337672 [Mycena vulgaris]